MRTSHHFEEQGVKFLAIVCLGLVTATSANPAAADPLDRGMEFRLMVQDKRQRPEPKRAAERPAPQRADKPAPQRETPLPGDADRGRMSADERRQLRRDIQDAGKDIYRRDRPAPRREQRR